MINCSSWYCVYHWKLLSRQKLLSEHFCLFQQLHKSVILYALNPPSYLLFSGRPCVRYLWSNLKAALFHRAPTPCSVLPCYHRRCPKVLCCYIKLTTISDHAVRCESIQLLNVFNYPVTIADMRSPRLRNRSTLITLDQSYCLIGRRSYVLTRQRGYSGDAVCACANAERVVPTYARVGLGTRTRP